MAIGREWYPVIDKRCRVKRHGSVIHGSWNVADDKLYIDKSSIVYSAGIGKDVLFDLSLIHDYGLTVHGFDPTPESIAWIESQQLPEEFVLHRYGISNKDGFTHFNPPEKPGGVSYTILDRSSAANDAIAVPIKRLKTIMKELRHDHIDILKMDIEGAEYRVIDDMIESNIRPRQLFVEFHHRFPGVGLAKTKTTVKKIRGYGYKLFSVSVTGEEYCFLREE